jgi:hypothetical protein
MLMTGAVSKDEKIYTLPKDLAKACVAGSPPRSVGSTCAERVETGGAAGAGAGTGLTMAVGMIGTVFS